MSAYTTTIEIVRNGEAHELEIEVAYRIHPGDRGDYYQPPSDATAEIEDISVVGIDGKKYPAPWRSEEHTSELQSLMRNSYAVFCLKKNINQRLLTHQICFHTPTNKDTY